MYEVFLIYTSHTTTIQHHILDHIVKSLWD